MSSGSDVQTTTGVQMVHRTYLLRLHGPVASHRQFIPIELLLETEENLTDLLPDGFSVRIREEEA